MLLHTCLRRLIKGIECKIWHEWNTNCSFLELICKKRQEVKDISRGSIQLVVDLGLSFTIILLSHGTLLYISIKLDHLQ